MLCHLRARELGASSCRRARFPVPSAGTLVLEDCLHLDRLLPFKVLDGVDAASLLRYIDLGGSVLIITHVALRAKCTPAPSLCIHMPLPPPLKGGNRADSLADFGGSAAALDSVVKLYASNCGLTSLDGLQHFAHLKYLYLDGCALTLAEVQSAFLCCPGLTGALEALDLSGNPAEAAFDLLSEQFNFQNLKWLNGKRAPGYGRFVPNLRH